MNRGKGRMVHRSAEHWREIVSRFEASGLTVEAFCSAEGLRRRMLRRWQHKFSLPGEVAPARKSTRKGFVELADTPAGAAALDFSSPVIMIPSRLSSLSPRTAWTFRWGPSLEVLLAGGLQGRRLHRTRSFQPTCRPGFDDESRWH